MNLENKKGYHDIKPYDLGGQLIIDCSINVHENYKRQQIICVSSNLNAVYNLKCIFL